MIFILMNVFNNVRSLTFIIQYVYVYTRTYKCVCMYTLYFHLFTLKTYARSYLLYSFRRIFVVVFIFVFSFTIPCEGQLIMTICCLLYIVKVKMVLFCGPLNENTLEDATLHPTNNRWVLTHWCCCGIVSLSNYMTIIFTFIFCATSPTYILNPCW